MKKEATSQQDRGRYQLNCHGYPPAQRRLDIHVLVDAIVDPKTDDRTNLICDFEETSEDTSNGGHGQLGDVRWYGSSDCSTA